MSIPSLQATSGNLIRDGIYTQAQIHADPETASLAPTLEGPQIALEKTVVDRRAADKVAITTAAVADNRLGTLQRAIVLFGTKLFGHCGSRTAAEYLRIYEKSPSDTAGVNPSERALTYANLRKRVTDPATPKELAPAVKVLVAAIDDWTNAVAAEIKAAEGLKAASKAESDAADVWQTAVRKLRGQLIVLFPRDVSRQRSYFPAGRSASKSKKSTTATAPTTPTT